MGSYNVACSISGVSINCGDKCVFIPLEEYKYSNKIADGNAYLIYPYCFYTPMCLPIKGEYADYGYMDNFEEDESTILIKKYFNMSLEDIVDLPKGKAKKHRDSGMYILREAYDWCVNNRFGESGKISSMFFDDINTIWDKLMENISVNTNLDMGLTYLSSPFLFKEYRTFRNIYVPHIIKNKFKDELVKFLWFEHGMASINKIYFPTANGYQFGNQYAEKNFYQHMNKYFKNRQINKGE